MGTKSTRLGISRARATKTAPATNPARPMGRLLAAPRRIVRRSAMIPPRSDPASRPRTRTAPALFPEVVAQERRAGRVVTRFPDPEHRSRNEELRVAPSQAREERGQAPDGDADADHRLADAAVGPDTEGNRRDRIDQQEGAPQQTNLAVGQMELGLDLGDDGREDVPVEVVQEVDADHDAEHVARVAAGHRRALCRHERQRGAAATRGGGALLPVEQWAGSRVRGSHPPLSENPLCRARRNYVYTDRGGRNRHEGGRPRGSTGEYTTWHGRWQRWRRLLGRTSESSGTLKIRRRAPEAWR